MPTLSRRRFLRALGWGAAGITVVAGGAAWTLSEHPCAVSAAWTPRRRL